MKFGTVIDALRSCQNLATDKNLIKKLRWRRRTVDILKATQQAAEPVRCRCRWGAYWRHLSNTIEPSVCGGDAALCKITLTICHYITKKIM